MEIQVSGPPNGFICPILLAQNIPFPYVRLHLSVVATPDPMKDWASLPANLSLFACKYFLGSFGRMSVRDDFLTTYCFDEACEKML